MNDSALIALVTMLSFGAATGLGQPVCRTLHSFGSSNPDSSHSRGHLIEGDDGALYGTTYGGGTSNLGTIFKLNRDGTGYNVLRNFRGADGDGAQPAEGLARATNGVLCGTTYSGGTSNLGTVFRINQDGSGYAVLKHFTGEDGATPCAAMTQAADGMLYGTTYSGGASNLGLVFRLALDGSAFTVLKNFTGAASDGSHPRGPVLQGSDGALYGTTQTGGTVGNGTVFTLRADGGGYAVLKSFGAQSGEGAEPYAPLTQATNSALYGTTLHGGYCGQGTVFRINPDGSGYTVIKVFHGAVDGSCPYAALLTLTNGLLCGTTWNGGSNGLGVVFQLDLDGNEFKVLKHFANADGAFPRASLLCASDGLLYGTTEAGGNGVSGTLFGLNPDGSGFVELRTFEGSSNDGVNPYAALMQASNGMLYGTAYSGGNSGWGVIFRMLPDGTGYSVMKSLVDANGDGANPYATLIQGNDGTLYGTAMYGGGHAYGTVFKLNPDGGGFGVIRTFAGGSDGGSPQAPLVLADNGTLYGTTYSGGSTKNYGTVFQLKPDGTGYTILRRFAGINGDGAKPVGALIQATNRALYGTTYSGGAASQGGTVFTLNLDGGGYTVLKSFTGLNGDGACPYAAVFQGRDGALYGTTVKGGKFGKGAVYRMTPDGSGCATILSFGSAPGDAASPSGSLVQAANGLLYGTTAEGGSFNLGTAYQLSPDGSSYAVLKSFNGTDIDGAAPSSALLLGDDGTLYGTTGGGFFLGLGTVFSLVPPVWMLAPVTTANGFRIPFYGNPGCSYNVQRAPSLTGPWDVLGTILVGPDGQALAEDRQPFSGSAFYRAVSQ